MTEIKKLQRQLWSLDKNGYLTLEDEELENAEILRSAIHYINELNKM